ncbi:MAG: PEP/pyruvate-binding domain-containing protein [Bacteroidales bacterium]|nr:PEP/pyruvate-binding domain-containing protein [Bacteroidales bacterium]
MIENDSINKRNTENGSKDKFKELAAISLTTNIVKEAKSINETLQQICSILPKALRYPESAVARIKFEENEFTTSNFRVTSWKMKHDFETIDEKTGIIEVYYTKEFPEIDNGPFSNDEVQLVDNISKIVTGYLNSIKIKNTVVKPNLQSDIPKQQNQGSSSRQLLQQYLNKSNQDRYIYHDLMPFKVREILLVSTMYDAFIIESEGRFSEYVLGEYYQLNLTSIPRITGVSTVEDAFELLNSKHFDLVIIMMGVDKNTPIELSKLIKNDYPYIPVLLLLNNNNDIAIFETDKNKLVNIDKIFIWNGDTKIFFAMIKYIEDRVNVENDTEVGLVRVILMVEDSPKYYSRYLPLLYTIVLEQTKRIMEDVTTDELYKVLRLRARPKILLASTYEEAINIFDKYKDYMLCLISDVKFERKGKVDSDAGFHLVKHIKSQIEDLPAIIQSSNIQNLSRAYALKASFIDKNSESLLHDFKSFIIHYLGFGDFVYKDEDDNEIAVARTLKEFEAHMNTIPDSSLIYHATRNHFSLWLMARGEIQIAKIIHPAKISDFNSPEGLRNYLINVIEKFRSEQNRGKVISFEESAIQDETNIISLASGSLGGKGRGLAFITTLVYNFDFSKIIPGIKIRTPKTSIIGTDEFVLFLERNDLKKVYTEKNHNVIKEWFLNGQLSESLMIKLEKLLNVITNPVAIRSSSLFEDSLMQPFSGIFDTILLPNSHPDIRVRVQQAANAIKLVYASIFSDNARAYFEAVNYKIEEEKMGIIIQEVVGNKYENYYYPHISGVAQSYNFYPFAHMEPEEGFAVTGIGLGKYIVEGEKAFRFSPKYPSVEINSTKDQIRNSQLSFYAVDTNRHDINIMEGEEAGLIRLDIDEAERHGNLKHCASVYDAANDRIVPGIETPGPRLLNFANIMKYDYIPLARTIDSLLGIIKEAMGSPIEIEFAIDLTKNEEGLASFYLLQIKPLFSKEHELNLNLEDIDKKQILLYSEKGMGNGKIDEIYDVIYIDTDKFDKSKTMEMTDEIEQLNAEMVKQNKKYVLIGPGRWGTRDRWIGIPVQWTQISNAKIIVETSTEDLPLDASLGSHFFHNITSLNIGYFSVQHSSQTEFIRWDVLHKQKVIKATKYFKHVRFSKPLSIIMDGKKRISFITWN